MRVAVWDGLRRLVERDPDGAGREAVYLLQTDHRPDAAAFAEAVVRFLDAPEVHDPTRRAAEDIAFAVRLARAGR